jgi:hypothetical protein
MSEVLTDAIRYWEARRIPYNAILSLIVAAIFLMNYPGSVGLLTLDLLELLFVLAVLANVAYCAAYVVDFVAQSSDFRSRWKQYRWVLFVIGVVFASILTQFFATKMFAYAA